MSPQHTRAVDTGTVDCVRWSSPGRYSLDEIDQIRRSASCTRPGGMVGEGALLQSKGPLWENVSTGAGVMQGMAQFGGLDRAAPPHSRACACPAIYCGYTHVHSRMPPCYYLVPPRVALVPTCHSYSATCHSLMPPRVNLRSARVAAQPVAAIHADGAGGAASLLRRGLQQPPHVGLQVRAPLSPTTARVPPSAPPNPCTVCTPPYLLHLT